MAGRGRFELPEVLPSPVFKTGTFDHSDISRHWKGKEFYLKEDKNKIKFLKNFNALEEPTRLELVNSRFAIYGLTNLAMAPVLFQII